MTLEEVVLNKIKTFVESTDNLDQAMIRLLEQYAFDKEEQSEQLRLASVSCQREQLLEFKKWELEVYPKPFDGDPNITVDTYLKAIAD